MGGFHQDSVDPIGLGWLFRRECGGATWVTSVTARVERPTIGAADMGACTWDVDNLQLKSRGTSRALVTSGSVRLSRRPSKG